MRRWVPLALAVVLLPVAAAALAAQKPATPCDSATKLAAPFVPGGAVVTAAINGTAATPVAVSETGPTTAAVSETGATTAATTRVCTDLASGKLNAWVGRGIRPASVTVAGALLNRTEGKAGIYVVGITAPNAAGHVRVIVDAKSGAVLGTTVGSSTWGAAPAWWQQGLSSPPPANPKSPPPPKP